MHWTASALLVDPTRTDLHKSARWPTNLQWLFSPCKLALRWRYGYGLAIDAIAVVCEPSGDYRRPGMCGARGNLCHLPDATPCPAPLRVDGFCRGPGCNHRHAASRARNGSISWRIDCEDVWGCGWRSKFCEIPINLSWAGTPLLLGLRASISE